MKESTKILFLRPILFQEMIPFVVLVPILVFFFRYISESVMHNFIPVVIVASVAANLGLFLGCMTKYYFVSPAIRILEKVSCTPEEIQHAVHHAAYLPLAESIVVFLRFAFFGNLIAATPLYLKGYIQYSEYLFALNSVTMIGMLAIPIFYLASENSLVHFFIKCNFKGIFDSEKGFFSINMSSKTLLTILLIAVPPIGLLTGLIYLSPATALNPASLQMSFFIILFETILIAVICGFLLMKNFSLSVGRMSIMFQDMAKGQGDLTKRLHVTGLNEIGKLSFWFNEFMNDIEEIIGHVMEASFQLHQTIEDVSSGSQVLSQATQEQASSIEEISASIEEMNATVQHNGGLIIEGQESSNAITKLIDQSKQLFSELMKAIESISMDSKKIWDIVSTVNEVAFHTNLLALNASVEAARAGEHGKGFAVVAGEVRSLAQRSAEAASEIKVLIESTVGRIKNGDEMMKKTSASLEELMSRMEFFFKMMDIISTSSTEQKQNISELNMAIGQIDGSTQHNAATVEELAGTLDNLRTAAFLLAEDVQKFKTS